MGVKWEVVVGKRARGLQKWTRRPAVHKARAALFTRCRTGSVLANS